MKKFIVLIIFIGLFIGSYIYQNEIYKFYKESFTKEEVTLTESNDYTRDYSFSYVALTNNFSPETEEEVRNLYYTVLNSGV